MSHPLSRWRISLAESLNPRRHILIWLLLAFLSACIPAQTPPNLSATPGAAVVITVDTYRNDQFSLDYPAGWRVITSPAGAPLSVTFVAPGNCPLIVVSSAPLKQPPTCDGKGVRNEQRTVTRGSLSFTIAGSTTDALKDSYLAALNRIIGTLALVP